MAIKPLNSVAGFSVGEVPTPIILANGSITTTNITANGIANLGTVANVYIFGGSAGQVLQTDGVGNLSWTSSANVNQIHNGDSNVTIPDLNGNVYINANSGVGQQWNFDNTGNLTGPAAGTANLGNLVIANYASFANGANVTGNIEAGGLLTDNLYYANGTAWDFAQPAGANTEIQYNDGLGGFGASNAFTFDYVGNVLSVTGTANITGNLTAGNIDGGNLVKANNFSTNGTGGDITLTGGNILGANVTFSDSFTANAGVVDFSTASNVALGDVANVHITGGTNGYLLTTDGSGNLTWTATASTSLIFNGNSNVTIPTTDGNVYINANSGADQQWNFGTDGVLYTPGNINLSGSSIVDNLGSGIELYSNYYAQLNYNNDVYAYVQANGVWLETIGGGNVHLGTDGNVTMSGNLEVQGNIANVNNISVTNSLAAGSANITNDLVVQGNIANANNITTTNDLTVGGNANVVNNLDVGGNIVTGTGSGGNISGVDVLTANTANVNNINTGAIANGTSNIRLAHDSNVTISVNNSSNVFTFSDLGANVLGYIQANGIISAGGFEGSNLVSNVGILSLQAKQTGGDYNINLLTGGNGTVDVGNVRITSLATPNVGTDAATKQYVDDVAQGLDVKASVHAATTSALPSYTYNNGASGVGATITANANGTLTLPGATISALDRILVKNEAGANAPYNGIYVITQLGDGSHPFILTRATDFDNGSPSGEIPGAFTFVEDGDLADTGWVCTTNAPVTMGTTDIVFVQFSGAGQYTAGAGLTLTGTTFSVNVDDVSTAIVGGNVVVKDGAQLNYPNIGAATGTSLDLTGNLTAGNVTSNATITGVDASLTGNLEVGGNITTTGATGNISGANVIFANSFTSNGGTVDFNTNSANVQLGSNANVHLYGGTNGQVLQTDGTGNLNWYSISTSSIQNGNSNVTIPLADGNIYLNANSGTDQQWNFDTTGNLTSPATSTANLGNLVVANYANFTNDVVVQGNIANANNITATNKITANTANIASTVTLGNTTVKWGTLTTSTITANQTIATLNVTGITGIEFLVKGVDSGGGKYSIATVQAVTDGANVDYSTFGSVQLGGYTGALAVNIAGSNISLQVTPASSNSTVWTTQYRVI